MPKVANQSKHWDFEVEQIPAPHPCGEKYSTGFFFNVRKDTKDVLGVTTDQYGIMQNKDLIAAAHAALDERGMNNYKQNIVVTGGGQRLFADFTFEDKTLKNDVGDVFGYKLTLQNSFDRTLRAAFSLGFLRLVCSNGMATLEREFSISQKHYNRISVDFVGESIDKALERGQEALKTYDILAQAPITNEQGQSILANLENAHLLSGKIKEGVETLWLAPKRKEDKKRNVYNLYNAITEYVSHQVVAERFEHGNNITGKTLLTLVNAIQNKEKFKKLLVMPKTQTPNVVLTASGPIMDVAVEK